MLSYSARELLAMPPEVIWGLPNGPIQIAFDDKTVITRVRQTIFSYYAWDVHRIYPGMPLLSSHHMGTKRITPRTHIDLLSRIIVDCRDFHRSKSIEIDNEILGEMAYDITNTIYNVFTVKLQGYVRTLSALDFSRVIKHPVINKALKDLEASGGVGEMTVNRCNEIIEQVLLYSPDLRGNGIAEALRSNLVSIGQVLQCVGARGYATDIDSTVFPKPIITGYARGITKVVDLLQDSRSAAKSLFFQRTPMQKSEYFNRACQLSAATLQNLHMRDCGNRDYQPITISSKRLLKDMVGKYFYDEEISAERAIRPTDTKLIGKTIPVRLIFSCKEQDRSGVCYKCFGELAFSIPAYTNIGHVAASEVQSKVAQLLLSNKHLDSSANVDKIFFDEYEAQYITTGKEENAIYFTPPLRKQKMTMIIGSVDAQNLSDLNIVASSDQLSPYRVAELTYVQLFPNDKPEKIAELRVMCGTRKAVFTRKALRYIKQKSWTINELGNYVIDLSDWDMSEPLMEMPLKHFSTVDYMQTIEGFIKGGVTKSEDSIMSYSTPAAALMAFHDLVSLKLDVNIVYLEAIILSTMVQSLDKRDYRIPYPRQDGQFAYYSQQMMMRSLSAAMAYQNQGVVLYAPTSYLVQNRPPHYLDSLVIY